MVNQESELDLFQQETDIAMPSAQHIVKRAKLQINKQSKQSIRQATVYIDAQSYKQIKRYCLEHDTTFSALVNELLRKYLK